MEKFCGKSETSIENPNLPSKIQKFRRSWSEFCGSFGFSAEDLDFLQKIGNFCGKTETSADCTNPIEEIARRNPYELTGATMFFA
jgi:hypothetical protein